MSNQIVITSGAKLRDLDDVIIGTDGILSSVAFNVANGVPRLDENGKILVSQLPNSVMEFKGVWNAATNSPTLVNGTGNAGDVWLCNVAGTVNFGAGPIVFAVGDYAVYTGTEWARSSGATGTVTSVGVSRDGNALTISGSPVTSAGTINLGFSGDNTQYINGAGNLTTFPTVINSIGLTMPAAFGVSNSPLVANGTIGVTALGFPSQYIRGDGTLADFPTSGGGGSSVSYYLNGGTSQGTIGGTTYYEMSKTADTGTMADFSKTGDGFIVAFLTDAGDPSLLQIPAGNWNYEIYASMSANGGVPELYAELYVYNGTTFTLISTSSNEILYDGTNLNLYSFAMTVPETVLTITDRLAIKLYATNSGGKTTTIHTQDSHLCQIITTFTTGLTALNGLTAQVQYFGTGTSGSDFNIVSSGSTHTFNIPSASATARGLITTGTQTIAGSKTITGTTTFTGGPILSDTNLTYANSGYTLVLQSPTLSVNRTVTLPNGTGTLALTSDISYPVTSVFGRTGAVVATEGDYTLTQLGDVTITSPSSGQVLKYNGTAWINDTDANTGTVTSVAMTVPTGLSIAGSPITSSGTLAVTFAAGYSIPTNASQTNWDTAYTNRITSLTTTGSSGAATLTSNTLNIPNYGSALSGYLPLSGGTLTGPLLGTSASFSSSVNGSFFSVIPSTNYNAQFDYTGGTRISQTAPSTEGTDSMTFVINGGSASTTGNAFIFKTQIGNTTPSAVLTILKTGVSTFSSSVTATSFIKTSGTSSQFLKADGSIDSSTYLTTSSAASTYLPLAGGTLTGPLGGTSATFNSNVFTLRSNIGTGTNDDPDISLNVSAPSGANKFIMFGRNGSNVAVFAINSAGYIGATGGNFIASSGTAIDVAGNAIFRGDTGVGSPRQLLITSGGSTPVYLEAKGYGANYVTDFGIKVMDNAGTQYTSIYVTGGNGYVGINQVSASYQLDVSGTFRATGAATFSSTVTAVGYSKFWNGTNSGLLIGNFSAGAGYGAIYSQSITPSSTNFALATNGLSTIINATNDVSLVINNGSSGLFVSSSGKVGINATSPQSTFVVGVSADTQGCEIDNATSGVPRIFAFNRSGGVSLPLALQSVGGNLLVGTTDDSYNYKLYVNGGSTNGFLFYTTSAANQIKAAGTAPAITFSNTITSPTIGGVLGAATASNQFVSGTASGDMVLANQFSTGALIFGTSNVERFRIAVGGGATFTSTVQANLAFRQYAAVGYYADFAYSGSTYNLGSGETTDNIDFKIAGGGTFTTGGGFRFFTQAGGSTPVERVNIKSGGQLNINGVAASSQIKLGILQTQNNHTAYLYVNNGSGNANVYSRVDATANVFSYFDYNGVIVGSVSTNGTTTAYNITSDYRLKQDFKNYNGLALISAIKTYDYEWKSDKSRMYGVIAHELQEVIPYAVQGQKDGEQMQGVDYSKIVPILIKSIQELKQEIDTLKNK